MTKIEDILNRTQRTNGPYARHKQINEKTDIPSSK